MNNTLTQQPTDIIKVLHSSGDILELVKEYIHSASIVMILTDTVDKPKFVNLSHVYKVPNDGYDYSQIISEDFEKRDTINIFESLASLFKRKKRIDRSEVYIGYNDRVDIQITRTESVLNDLQHLLARQ